jgi:polyhydroxybutyrate depolymerase
MPTRCWRRIERNEGMPERRSILPLLLIALGALIGASPQVCAHDSFQTLVAGGYVRTLTVFIPDRLAEVRRPLPAVFVLHGGLGSGANVRRQMRMDAVAEREGFIVVYPDGLERGWNDGRNDRARQRGRAGAADDVAFLTLAAQRLIRQGLADPARIYLTGVSNGGMMSLRMACDAPPLFAGIAPIIASLPADIAGRCRPRRATPLLIINGTADPLVPYNGGEVGFRGERGAVLPTEETIAFWRRVNGCSSRAMRSQSPGRSAGSRTRAEVSLYRECSSGAPVALVRIEGGGHRIPGREERPQPWADRLLGPQNTDFETAEVVWQFFLRPAGS